MNSANPRLQSLLQQLSDPAAGSLAASALDLDWLVDATDDEVRQLVELLQQSAETQVIHERVLSEVFRRLRPWNRRRGMSPIPTELVAALGRLYRELGRGRPSRYQLLQVIAALRQPEALRSSLN